MSDDAKTAQPSNDSSSQSSGSSADDFSDEGYSTRNDSSDCETGNESSSDERIVQEWKRDSYADNTQVCALTSLTIPTTTAIDNLQGEFTRLYNSLLKWFNALPPATRNRQNFGTLDSKGMLVKPFSR